MKTGKLLSSLMEAIAKGKETVLDSSSVIITSDEVEAIESSLVELIKAVSALCEEYESRESSDEAKDKIDMVYKVQSMFILNLYQILSKVR